MWESMMCSSLPKPSTPPKLRLRATSAADPRSTGRTRGHHVRRRSSAIPCRSASRLALPQSPRSRRRARIGIRGEVGRDIGCTFMSSRLGPHHHPRRARMDASFPGHRSGSGILIQGRGSWTARNRARRARPVRLSGAPAGSRRTRRQADRPRGHVCRTDLRIEALPRRRTTAANVSTSLCVLKRPNDTRIPSRSGETRTFSRAK